MQAADTHCTRRNCGLARSLQLYHQYQHDAFTASQQTHIIQLISPFQSFPKSACIDTHQRLPTVRTWTTSGAKTAPSHCTAQQQRGQSLAMPVHEPQATAASPASASTNELKSTKSSTQSDPDQQRGPLWRSVTVTLPAPVFLLPVLLAFCFFFSSFYQANPSKSEQSFVSDSQPLSSFSPKSELISDPPKPFAMSTEQT